ncbi:MAG: sulfotransferase domain-containing protein [Anaerolineales bacterium]|jgi:hypothetical protein
MINIAKRAILKLAALAEGDQVQTDFKRSLDEISEEELQFIRMRYSRPKFFIMGHARSGTTLLGRLVRLHPDVHCSWQMQFFSERGLIPELLGEDVQRWLNHRSNHWSEGWDPTSTLLRVCCDQILERGAEKVDKRIVGDKSVNGNGGTAVEWAASIYPDAKLIYILRDGRDTILSKRVQQFIDQPQYLANKDRKILSELKERSQDYLSEGSSIFTREWLDEAAAKWAHDVQASVEIGKERFGDQFLVVRYEDLISEAANWMARTWSFLGAGALTQGLKESIQGELERNPSAAWHESLGIEFVSELPRGMHGGWKQVFTREDTERFHDIAGERLKEWGYL